MNITAHEKRHSGQVAIARNKFLFPAGEAIEGVYRAHYKDAIGSKFKIQTLHMGVTPELVNTTVRLVGSENVALSDGATKTLKKFALLNPRDKSKTDRDVVYEWRDERGKLFKAVSTRDETEILDTALAPEKTPQTVGDGGKVYAQTAQTSASNSSVDVMAQSQISTNRIGYPRETYSALYHVMSLPAAGLTGLDRLIPQNAQQKLVKTADDGSVFLRITTTLPENSEITYPILYDKDYLVPGPLMESNDFDIVRTAKSVVGKENRAYIAALKLRQWVNENIANKDMDVAFGSAKETLNSREGDCTEHAVLLAALTRSLGIPTRLAVGLVYLPQEDSNSIGHFVFHMWTEIYLGDLNHGEWYPMDASFPEKQMDATHIKLFDTALSNESDLETLARRVTDLMGRLRIDVSEALAQGGSVISLSQKTDTELNIPHIDIQRVDIRKMSDASIGRYRVEPIEPGLSLRSPEGLLSLAVQYLANNQYDEAVAAIATVSAKTKDAEGHYRLARQLLALELYGLANQEFHKAAQMDSSLSEMAGRWSDVYVPNQLLGKELEAQFIDGVNMESRDDDNGAIQAFKDLAQQAPGFSPVYLHLGSTYLAMGDASSAIDAYQQYAEKAPNDPRGLEGVAEALMQEKQFTKAAQAYQQALGVTQQLNLPSARFKEKMIRGNIVIANSDAVLAGNHNSASAWLTMGKGLYEQGNLEEAQKAFENASNLSPGYGEARLWAFKMMLENGDWAQLPAAYNSVVSHAGGEMAETLKGHYNMRVRHYPQAEADLKQAIAQSPSTPDNYDLLSQVYMRESELAYRTNTSHTKAQYEAMARDILKQGIGRVSDTAGKNRLRTGLAHLLMEKEPQAADALADAVLADASSDAHNDPDADTLKGQTSYHAGRLDEAQQYLKKALIANSFDTNAMKTLGDVERDQGAITQALYYYQEAVAADPGDTAASNTLADLIEQNHLPVKAPRRLMVLTDDESDYLITMAARTIPYYNRFADYTQKLADLVDDDFKHMTVLANEKREQRITVVKNLYDYLERYYQETQAIIPPYRMITKHTTELEAEYDNLQSWRLNIPNAMGETFNLRHFDELNSAIKEQGPQTQEAILRANVADNAILKQIPLLTYERLSTEFGNQQVAFQRLLDADKSLQQKLAKYGDTGKQDKKDASGTAAGK